MVWIVTAIHNRKELTREFLASLRAQTFQDITIVLVDDGSTDGSREMIEREFPEVTILEGDGTLWWTGSLNLALQYVLPRAKESDFALLVNSDHRLNPDCIEELVRASKERARCIVAALVRDAENKEKIIDAGIRIDWEHYRFLPVTFKAETDGTEDAATLSTRATLMPVEIIRRAGLLDQKNFRQYGSDYDYFLRAKKTGAKLFVSYRAVAYDHINATGFKPAKGRILSPRELRDKYFSIRSPHNVRQNLIFLWRHCPSFWLKFKHTARFVFGIPIKIIWEVLRYFFLKFGF